MKDKVIIPGTFRLVTLVLTGIGIAAFVSGILTNTKETWASYLVVNYYFFSITIGALFFLVLQRITQSGWSSAFNRVPEALMSYLPFAACFFLLLWFGLHDLYSWSDKSAIAGDELLSHKSPYMNIPFFFGRMAVFFALWIILCQVIRNLSKKEDLADPSDSAGIMKLFEKSELFSKILIFVLAISFSLASFDWIMSIDVKWYSTLFALKNLVAAFLHGVSILTLIVFILYKRGYFTFLNKYHLHDFSRYIFMLSIVWGYFWFAQFMIIWYGNLPEETAYYYTRWQNGWKILFFAEMILNWAIPFMVLLPVKASRNMTVVTFAIIVLIIGQYVDIFCQVMPGTTGIIKFGWIEAGMFIGYAGLFSLIVATALSKASLIPRNHPYLEESLEHSFK